MADDLDAPDPPRRRHVAVVGGGLAGLAAAWWLGRRHRVTLFERQRAPGFVAHSVTLPPRFGPAAGARVDVPLRVFYPGYYPTLVQLYAELGVRSEPVSYASSFFGADGALVFRYRNWRRGGRSVAYVLPQDLRGAAARRIALGALAFRHAAVRAQAQGTLAGRTIGEFARDSGASPAFVDGLLLPAIATVCTCPYDAARGFPAEVVVRYLLQGLTRQSVRRACQGADDVAARLVAGIAELRCGAPVQALHRTAAGVAVHGADGALREFDHVVLATQANHALELLADATPAERAALGGFGYRDVRVLMHDDDALLPARRRDWSPVNLRVVPGAPGPESTIWINAVQPSLRDAPAVFQTVAPQREPRPGRLVAEARFQRPVVDAVSERALGALAALHAEPGRRVWFCGSYAQPGIPLLESAVRSARVVADALDAARPRADGPTHEVSRSGAAAATIAPPRIRSPEAP